MTLTKNPFWPGIENSPKPSIDQFVLLMIDDTFWPGLTEREDYKRKKEANKISYDWDRLGAVALASEISEENATSGP